MKNYEFLLIINPRLSDEEIPSFLEGVFSAVKKNNGSVVEHKILGRNKLAYPLKHAKFGVYVLMQVEIESLEVKKLSSEISIMPEILRFDVSNEVSKGDFTFKPFEIKDPSETEAPRTPRPPYEEKKAESVVENIDVAQPIAEVTEKVAEILAEEPEVAPVVTEEVEKKTKDAKVSLDELDKKLDEILKEEII
jgi:small subunit ribosomal protein S6